MAGGAEETEAGLHIHRTLVAGYPVYIFAFLNLSYLFLSNKDWGLIIWCHLDLQNV